MSHMHRLTFIVSLALLTGCAASDDPMALVQGSAASSVADDESVSAASLTLPFSGSYNGILAAFTITQTGSGRAGHFENNSATNPRAALTAQTAGTSQALYTRSYGTGITAWIENTNPNNTREVLRLESDGTGNLLRAISTKGVAVRAENLGSNSAGYFGVGNASSLAHSLVAHTIGGGAALSATTNGSGFAGIVAVTNSGNSKPALLATTSGTSNAGMFQTTNLNNSEPALVAQSLGVGPALRADRQNANAGDIAVFRNDAINQARIDGNGTGFFNGGTQTGGADVAEAFEVEGRVGDYGPGDVLVISTRSDQRVARSHEAYSTRVIGVYATKPGVLLTERGVDDSLDDMIPVGVVGIIPTRVSAENGAIKRGDILVTARTSGHAMRASPHEVNGVELYPSGAILGKALQNFAGPGTGMIKVLVNVK